MPFIGSAWTGDLISIVTTTHEAVSTAGWDCYITMANSLQSLVLSVPVAVLTSASGKLVTGLATPSGADNGIQINADAADTLLRAGKYTWNLYRVVDDVDLHIIGGTVDFFAKRRMAVTTGSGNYKPVGVSDAPTDAVGPQGPQGLQGDPGPAGADGAQGLPGNDGAAGVPGADGDDGAQGVPGNDGAAGAQGPQGPAGNDGAAGAAGADGPQGPQGPQGVPGADGAAGAQGIQGPAGSTGSDGAQGPQGAQGIQGLTGNTGPQGTIGNTGNAGSQGIQGIQGIQGDTGAQGPAGAPGLVPSVYTLAGDQATGANVTPVTLTGLVFTYAANSIYRLWFMGRISGAAATTGAGFQFDLSSAVTDISLQFFHQLANTGTMTGGHSIADDASVGVSSGLPATSAYPVTGFGLIRTAGNTGTAQLRFRSETTAVITARAGLTLVVEKIT